MHLFPRQSQTIVSISKYLLCWSCCDSKYIDCCRNHSRQWLQHLLFIIFWIHLTKHYWKLMRRLKTIVYFANAMFLLIVFRQKYYTKNILPISLCQPTLPNKVGKFSSRNLSHSCPSQSSAHVTLSDRHELAVYLLGIYQQIEIKQACRNKWRRSYRL